MNDRSNICGNYPCIYEEKWCYDTTQCEKCAVFPKNAEKMKKWRNTLQLLVNDHPVIQKLRNNNVLTITGLDETGLEITEGCDEYYSCDLFLEDILDFIAFLKKVAALLEASTREKG